MSDIISLAIGFILDLIFGDPYYFFHPVRIIGFFIEKGEKIIRKIMPKTNKAEFIGGMILTILICTSSFFVSYCLLAVIKNTNEILYIMLNSIFLYQILAINGLKKESSKILNALKNNDLYSARKELSLLVSRQTENLSKKEIIIATIETISENITDAIVSPLIFIAIGGAPLGFLYKAVNTLDSMIGYMNEKYMFFGKFSAKLDDVMNFIPARTASYIMIAASFLLKYNYKNAVKIYKRDKRKHESPNSAHTESTCAGALNIRLGGKSIYFGKIKEKPYIGDDIAEPNKRDIIKAQKLSILTAILLLLVILIVRILILLF